MLAPPPCIHAPYLCPDFSRRSRQRQMVSFPVGKNKSGCYSRPLPSFVSFARRRYSLPFVPFLRFSDEAKRTSISARDIFHRDGSNEIRMKSDCSTTRPIRPTRPLPQPWQIPLGTQPLHQRPPSQNGRWPLEMLCAWLPAPPHGRRFCFLFCCLVPTTGTFDLTTKTMSLK